MQDLIVHGFCKGFKTSTSIMLEVMCDIFKSRYLRSSVAHKQLPRMSLSTAFNTIDHQILLNVLENDFGITASALDWFASYLSDRKQRVLIKDQYIHTYIHKLYFSSNLRVAIIKANISEKTITKITKYTTTY